MERFPDTVPVLAMPSDQSVLLMLHLLVFKAVRAKVEFAALARPTKADLAKTNARVEAFCECAADVLRISGVPTPFWFQYAIQQAMDEEGPPPPTNRRPWFENISRRVAEKVAANA